MGCFLELDFDRCSQQLRGH